MRNEEEKTQIQEPETLLVDGCISTLKEQGVTFERYSEDEAKAYLNGKNYPFKTTAYKKLFDTYEEGENTGKFIDLDFSQLVFLSAMDQNLREVLLDMTLDIEHFCKTRLLHESDEMHEDGYAVVADYMSSLDARQREYIESEIARRASSPYYREIIDAYKDSMSIWSFAEVVSFGVLLGLVKYCAERWDDDGLLAQHYIFRAAQSIRNACAHGSCILLHLRARAAENRLVSPEVQEAVAKAGVSKRLRSRWLQNPQIGQATSVLYLYGRIVPDGSTRTKRIDSLKGFFSEVEQTSSVIPAKNQAMAAVSFLKRLTKAFGLLN